MKTFFTYRSLLVLGLLLVASPAAAYDVLDTQAVQVTNTTTLYTITYEWGFLNATAVMPIAPSSALTRDANPKIAYSFRNSNGQTVDVASNAIVVADNAAVRDGYYYVPAGERAQFTLIVLRQHAASAAPENLAVQVDWLSGVAITDTEPKYMPLSSDELTNYRTPFQSPATSIQVSDIKVDYTVIGGGK